MRHDFKVKAPLDPEFLPMEIVCRDFQKEADAAGGKELVIGIVRNNEYTSAHVMTVFPDGTGHDDENFSVVERVVKSLLWARGGYKIILAGSPVIGRRIAEAYAVDGLREFDRNFMARVYERDFEVELRDITAAPVTFESTKPVGRHLEGCRIGFDAGGSDRKVSAVIDGEPVYSEEVVWFPKTNSDPRYHYDGILEAMKTAASKMPRVDAIGVSSAGIYIDNKTMAASLFLKVSEEDFARTVKTMYIDIAKELGHVPLKVANDGDVTALAGAMSLNDVNILGIAMGTSEAAGYVGRDGNITGWLNELAFVPVDANQASCVDEWSGDYGCGVKYMSQDAVIKLAPAAGIELDPGASPGERLKAVQALMEQGHDGARKIFETIGVYFGFAVAYYARFYDIRHVLFLGRVSSGEGGEVVLDFANRVLAEDFPELAGKIAISLPDEKSRRVGQSVAAASLPD